MSIEAVVNVEYGKKAFDYLLFHFKCDGGDEAFYSVLEKKRRQAGLATN